MGAGSGGRRGEATAPPLLDVVEFLLRSEERELAEARTLEERALSLRREAEELTERAGAHRVGAQLLAEAAARERRVLQGR